MKTKRVISAKGRAAISKAQKKRWTEFKKSKEVDADTYTEIEAREFKIEALSSLLGTLNDYQKGYIDGYIAAKY